MGINHLNCTHSDKVTKTALRYKTNGCSETGDKLGDGLTGQEKGHSVEQRMMLAGTCQKFVSVMVERTLREAIRKQQQENRVVHTDIRREVELSGMRSAKCHINEGRSSNE